MLGGAEWPRRAGPCRQQQCARSCSGRRGGAGDAHHAHSRNYPSIDGDPFGRAGVVSHMALEFRRTQGRCGPPPPSYLARHLMLDVDWDALSGCLRRSGGCYLSGAVPATK